jgi:gliding motility-associated-like protein
MLNGVAQDSGSFTGLLPGNYLELVTDVNGCQATTSFKVSAPGHLAVSLSSTEQVILTGMETQLIATATTDTSTHILHYFWTPDSARFDFRNCTDATNCHNPFAAPRTTTVFTVTVMSSDSCYVSDTVTVQVLPQPSAFIPSAFTPNGDGLNDRFEFDILGATNIDIAIFDRWGSKVYVNPAQENKMTGSNGWDGNVNGKPAAFDTYVYQMKVTYWDDTTKDFTGTVTLMK